MKQDLQSRIHSMYLRDCITAYFGVVLLWATIAFVFVAILGFVENPGIRMIMYISSAILVLYNTASVTAMVRHYTEDKSDIYGLDIAHLDANRAAKAAAKNQNGS